MVNEPIKVLLMKAPLLLAALTLPLSSFAFSDITIRDEMYDSTTYLEAVEVFTGYEDGTFGRDKTINRAEALKTILTAAETEMPETTTERFSDVPADIWFAPYVNYSAGEGIVSGDDTTGLFSPGRNVNKAEFLKMLMLSFEVDPAQYPVITDVVINDVPEGIWFEPYFKFAVKFNILELDDEGNVNPGLELSRGQASEILFSMVRQGKGLKPQVLLNLSELHLLKAVEFMEQDAVSTAQILVDVAGQFSTYGLEMLPENKIVQSADKVIEAMKLLTTTYAMGADGNLQGVIDTSKEAWATADESLQLNPQNKVLTDKIKDIAASIADKARAQQ